MNNHQKRSIQLTHALMPWLALVLLPLLVIGLLWKFWVSPNYQKLLDIQDTEILLQDQPKLEALIAKSDVLLENWSRKEFSVNDPESVVQWMQASAKTQDVRIEDIHRKEQDSSNGSDSAASVPISVSSRFSLMPAELVVKGSYQGIAQWLGVIEMNPYAQIQKCVLRSLNDKEKECQLNITLEFLLKKP